MSITDRSSSVDCKKRLQEKASMSTGAFRLSNACLMHLEASVGAAATPISVSTGSLGEANIPPFLSLDRLPSAPDRHYLLQTSAVISRLLRYGWD